VGPSTSQRPQGTASPTTLPAPTTTGASSPLQRVTSRPRGLAAQFNLGLGGADHDCAAEEPPSAAPSILGVTRPELGLLYLICFFNFADQEPVQVAITDPHGSVERLTAHRDPDAGIPVLWWGSEPGDPLGGYDIVATQGSRTTRTSFRLERQRLRTLRVVQSIIVNDWVQAGTTVRVVLSGFAPHGRVQLHVYHLPLRDVSEVYDGRSAGIVARREAASYRSTVALAMNSRGELIHHIPTSSADPKGCYVFQTTPPPQVAPEPDQSHYASWVGPIERFCLR
jgi:hypothetical protein